MEGQKGRKFKRDLGRRKEGRERDSGVEKKRERG